LRDPDNFDERIKATRQRWEAGHARIRVFDAAGAFERQQMQGMPGEARESARAAMRKLAFGPDKQNGARIRPVALL
jgi:hypothetical protein